ncbi:MAG: Gfo/Idh/MocA family oxidoreductase [Planctomycetes bacterium]|nr:Gfo/Idh/MocA family oxidoreductase [Planctomycetota bacterium]
MRLAIVGCGLIGNKRAKALGRHRLVAAVDPQPARAQQLAAQHAGCTASADWRAAVARDDVDAIIVSTTNDALASVTAAALACGKHVLVEKPAARSAEELRPVAEAARRAGRIVKVGFNHRFHPALAKARQLCDAGELGPLLYIRGRYGHGGRPGYEREWRADPAVAGGGELLDQGVHLVDLTRWFLGDVAEVRGHVETFFWKMPVEDNGFVFLRTPQGQVAWLHASCTEWKNLFCFEVFGRDGKVQVDGLGGSYGTERLTFYRMLPQMGPPETTTWEYPGEDASWRDEFADFVRCIETGAQPEGGVEDALAALQVVGQVYEPSGRAVLFPQWGKERTEGRWAG